MNTKVCNTVLLLIGFYTGLFASPLDSIKPNKIKRFELNIGVLHGLKINDELTYHKDRNTQVSHDSYYHLNVQYSNQVHYPVIQFNYSLPITSTKKLFPFLIYFGVDYAKIVHKAKANGYFEDGYTGRTFSGTIDYENRLNVYGITTGLKIMQKCRNGININYSAYINPKYNLKNRVIYADHNNLPSEKSISSDNTYKVRLKYLFSYRDEFIVDAGLRFGISKQWRYTELGCYAGWSITNYVWKQNSYSLFNYTFLKNYNFLNYGITLKF